VSNFTNEALGGEDQLWSGSPHWAVDFRVFAVCGALFFLVVPLIYGFWRYLLLKSVKYELSSQRFKIRKGVFNRQTDELELYRVKDITCFEPFFLRLFGVGNIYVFTSDRTTPVILIAAVREHEKLSELIRNQVENVRFNRGVREIDIE
jgi:uncharacterized membrane protein YdbT with pleckstrin-like domain